MNEPRYAWSDGPDHIVVRHGNGEHGYSLNLAKQLHAQLGAAIAEAEQTPFQRWWAKQPSCGCPEGFRTICDRKFHQDEAEALFNAIRSAQ